MIRYSQIYLPDFVSVHNCLHKYCFWLNKILSNVKNQWLEREKNRLEANNVNTSVVYLVSPIVPEAFSTK